MWDVAMRLGNLKLFWIKICERVILSNGLDSFVRVPENWTARYRSLEPKSQSVQTVSKLLDKLPTLL